MMVCIGGKPSIVFDGGTGKYTFDPCSIENGRSIRYAYRNAESSTWIAGFLRPFDAELVDAVVVEDPCVAPGSGISEFVVVAKTANKILSCVFNAETGVAQDWTPLFVEPPGPGFAPLDKPWVLRATPELHYVTFLKDFVGPLHVWTGTQGGTNWIGGQISVAGAPYTTGFCPQPAYSPIDGELYVMSRGGSDARVLRMLVDGAQPVFETLRSAPALDLVLPLGIYAGSTPSCLPVPAPSGQSGCAGPDELRATTVPYLIADPSDSGRLYLVHNDVGVLGSPSPENDDPSDMDVLCRRIDRDSEGHWAVTSTVRIPHCITPVGCPDCAFVEGPCQHPDAPDAFGRHPDQFCPAAAVDRHGWVHVIYYSNAKTCGIAALGRQYDVYYALSTDHGETFTIYNLRTCLQRPALDLDREGLNADWSPREYNGISLDDSDPQHTYVTVTYSGVAWGPNTTTDPTAIYASVIRVTDPTP